MAYTALFIEVFIVGFQASTWILLLLTRFFVRAPIPYASLWTTAASTGAVTLLVPWIYTIGILFDRMADDLFWKVIAPPVLKRKHLGEKHFKEMCVLVIEKGGTASVDFYRYYLSRVRIMRAAAINIPCLFLSAGMVHTFKWTLFVPLGCFTTALVIWAYLTLVERYFTKTIRIYELLMKPPASVTT